MRQMFDTLITYKLGSSELTPTLADLMTCSTSKISRLETGKGIPKMPDIHELIRIYGVTSSG